MKESLVLVKEKVDHENSGWDMVHEDGEMRVYLYNCVFTWVDIVPQYESVPPPYVLEVRYLHLG